MNTYLFKKVLLAIIESYKLLRPVSSPKIIMTLLVKNEEGMLEQNILFHKSMGVDAFIITDNNSTDGTLDIIRKYQEKGWIVEVIKETGTNYEQKVWVDRMIWKAKTKYHADWVINADADELWYSPSGNIKNELKQAKGNVQNCMMTSVYPEEDKPFWQWGMTVSYVDNPEKYDLSVYSLFERQNRKIIHRTSGYLQISMGNHKVTMFPKHSEESLIRVYHYNVKGRQTFIDKMINGGKQLEQRKQRHGGRHWRYFYRLYKEGKLNEEYDRVIGKNVFNELFQDGFIQKDITIPSYFKNVLSIQ